MIFDWVNLRDILEGRFKILEEILPLVDYEYWNQIFEVVNERVLTHEKVDIKPTMIALCILEEETAELEEQCLEIKWKKEYDDAKQIAEDMGIKFEEPTPLVIKRMDLLKRK